MAMVLPWALEFLTGPVTYGENKNLRDIPPISIHGPETTFGLCEEKRWK